ncbi:hypothetical protein [Prochlorothrix hollandica]|uniref:hypothetical protein n=1 Tax=Prochlorothrix hollandica TaxID=1223 RepID=UPI00034C09FD|nr:hypothetical protein [Prochlorothrix hollandica]
MSLLDQLLEQLSKLETDIRALEQQRGDVLSDLEAAVKESGEMEVKGHGYVARFSASRKTTNHEQAARDAGAPEDLIKKHSKVEIRTSWAQVTKALKLDTTEYTTGGDPVFTVKPLAETP